MISEKLILTPEDMAPSSRNLMVEGVFNPGATRLKDGRIMLLARVSEVFSKDKCSYLKELNGKIVQEKISKSDIESINGNMIYLKNKTYRLSNISHFRRVILDKSGFEILKIEQKPAFSGIECESEFGVEDSRITKIGNSYLMSYVGVSMNNEVSTYLATSQDAISWKRKGIIFSHQNKDVVIFPEKINGKHIALHRPSGNFEFVPPSIWVSYSKDLKFWGAEKSIIQPRNGFWDSVRIGAGCPPIKLDEGWLLIYHGVTKNKDKETYSAGAILLDLKNPEKVLARTDKPLFSPKKEYEKKGFVNSVVFPTGAIVDEKDLLIYSGAGDRCVSVRKIPIKEILASMEKP